MVMVMMVVVLVLVIVVVVLAVVVQIHIFGYAFCSGCSDCDVGGSISNPTFLSQPVLVIAVGFT